MRETTLCYIEREGRYLMLHRTKKENDLNGGKWIGVGGKLEPGETPNECVLRETREETGLSLTSYKQVGIIHFILPKWEDEDTYLYVADSFEGELTECDEGDLEWIPKEEIMNLRLWEGDRVFLPPMMAGETGIELTLIYDKEDNLIGVLNHGSQERN